MGLETIQVMRKINNMIEATVRHGSSRLFTTLLARVDTFTDGMIECTPIGKTASGDDFPSIPEVPLAPLSGGGFSLYVPITSGDYVLLLFNYSPLEEYKGEGEDGLYQDLSNGIAIPLGFDTENPYQDTGGELLIEDKTNGNTFKMGPLGVDINGGNLVVKP